jgi:hypothetical protein
VVARFSDGAPSASVQFVTRLHHRPKPSRQATLFGVIATILQRRSYHERPRIRNTQHAKRRANDRGFAQCV